MELALITVDKIIVMFMIALIGLIATKCSLIDERTNEKLSNILLLLIIPLMLFTSYQQKFDASMLRGLIIAAALAAASHVIAIVLSGILISKKTTSDRSIERFSVIYTNCGFMGIPLIDAIFGAEGVFYVTAYITVCNVFCWTQGVVMMTGKQDLKSSVKALVTPCIAAIILGITFYCARILLPPVLLEPLTRVADMNTPLAMLVAGGSVANGSLWAVLKKKRIYYICLVRLIIVPLTVLLLFKALPINEMIMMTMLMSTACPAGATGTMFALRYHKDAIYATEIFCMTTLLSLVTIPFVVLVAQYL